MKIVRLAYQGTALLLFLWVYGCSEVPAEKEPGIEIYEGIEFAMPRVMEPKFPDYSYLLLNLVQLVTARL